jgi:outer membrane protein insertion porin family
MKRQYLSRGRYAAKVTVTVTPQERNRVAINIVIEEGDAAKIARINIVGESAYSESELLSLMTLTTPGWTTWYTKNDQYSKQKLSADLETLRSFYQNRGYLEFNVDSTQVSITPDKEDIYITINITEGPRYTVSDIRLGRRPPIPASELTGLVQVRVGEYVLAGAPAGERQGDQRPPRHGGLRVRERQRDPRSIATSCPPPSRSSSTRPQRLHPQDQHQRQRRTRDEVIRREMRQLEAAVVRRRAHRALEDPHPPARLLRRCEHRDAAGRRARRTRRMSEVTVVREGHRQPACRHRLLLRRKSSSSTRPCRKQNIFGSGNALTAGINTSSGQSHRSP